MEEITIKGLNKNIIIALLVLLIALLGVGIYFITKNNKKEVEKPNIKEEEKVDDKENTKEEEKEKEEVKEEPKQPTSMTNTTLDVEKACGVAKKGNICIKKINFGGYEEELRIIPTSNIVDPNTYEYKQIALNGILVIEEELGRIGKITVMDDIFILDIYCTNCGGASSGVPHTKIVDMDGNKVFDLYDINFEKNFNYEKYTVKDNEIIVTASGVGYFGDYMPSFDCYLKNVDTGIKGIENNNVVNGTNYDKFSSTVAKAEYKVPYLGKNRFSIPVKIKEIKFGELYTKAHCIEEYAKYEKEKDMY